MSYQLVIGIDFSISNKNPNNMVIDNIRPNDAKVDPLNIVNTTAGPQTGGVDMGHAAMKWLFRSTKEFALGLGYTIKQISSSNRYTGSRAKNNMDPSNTQFDVDMNVREQYVYDCVTGILERFDSV